MSWSEYVIEVAGTNQSAIADRLKVPSSTVNRWFKGAEPTVTYVVRFINEYDRDFTEAFLAAAGEDWRRSAKRARAVTEVQAARRREPRSAPGDNTPR